LLSPIVDQGRMYMERA